jgi:hypothetical protein
MRHELWDFETGNLVGAYGTRGEALDAVYQTVRFYGRAAADSLLLGREGAGRQSTLIAKGPDLVDLAIGAAVAGRTAVTGSEKASVTVCQAPSGGVGARSSSGRFARGPRSVSQAGKTTASKSPRRGPKRPPAKPKK